MLNTDTLNQSFSLETPKWQDVLHFYINQKPTTMGCSPGLVAKGEDL